MGLGVAVEIDLKILSAAKPPVGKIFRLEDIGGVDGSSSATNEGPHQKQS
ncbi:hypothetical protein CCACVL1_30640 [Corchorus capsularis]|uniref:Uncharacterized protein n=1 Tax=Corchorus capsularis TaxID=210143 RepID=A0A1R3FW80_COCAP|nr:hypothetical protein CCACVL1_30640 [Corchorus capsularis]